MILRHEPDVPRGPSSDTQREDVEKLAHAGMSDDGSKIVGRRGVKWEHLSMKVTFHDRRNGMGKGIFTPAER